MHMKKLFLLVLTLGYICTMPTRLHSMPGFGGAPAFNPNMSEEEMLNKLMEEINAAIPEDQRESFWKEVEAETRRLEDATAHMSEEEKQAYLLNEMNKAIEEAEQPVSMPEPVIEKKEKAEEKPKPKPAPVKEAIESGEIIRSIVKSINIFLNKAAAFPDFEGKIDRWAKQNLLSDWTSAETWERFKYDVNKFSSLLQRFQEKDAKIGMKHIDALAKNEQALAALKQLEAKLTREVPTIDVSVFAISSMSKKTKNAIAHTVNALTEIIYKVKLGETLQKIIEEFDPIAKKLREEEEKAAKEALAKTQRPASAVPVRAAGKERKGEFRLPSLDDYGISRGGAGSPFGGGYGKGGSGGGTGESGADGKGGSGSKGGAAAGGKGGATGDKKDGKSSDDKKDGKGKAPEAITTIKNPEIKEHVDNFKKAYADANKLIIPIEKNL